jgi:predicted Zn finger-like uncharacterized protein
MATSLTCPECDATLKVPDSAIGKTVRCKKCGETFKAKASRDRDDEDEPAPKAKPSKRPVRDDDEDDQRPRRATGKKKKRKAKPKSPLPLVVGIAGGAVVLVAVGLGIAYFAGAFDSKTDPKKGSGDAGKQGAGGAPDSPQAAADKAKATERLVGRWMVDPNRNPPDGFFDGYILSADGTYTPLFNKQGEPFSEVKGTWAVVQSSGTQGRISLKGNTAPPFDNLTFELRGNDVLVIRTSDGGKQIEVVYSRVG